MKIFLFDFGVIISVKPIDLARRIKKHDFSEPMLTDVEVTVEDYRSDKSHRIASPQGRTYPIKRYTD